jgi:circadian clock protein KaiC
MTDRLPSGSDRLDAVLGGGLPLNAIALIIGSPGTGKTMLAQQYLFHNATAERPAIYLSTVSEPLEKILRYGQSLQYFDASALGSSVMYEDLGQTLNDVGLPSVLSRVTELIRQKRPGLIVIDSFKALQDYAPDAQTFRHFLHDLAGHLSATPVTSLWVGEYDAADVTVAPEFAVADAIVSLSTERDADRKVRTLEVLKLRGSGFLSGKHAYRLSAQGLDVFPRLADRVVDLESYREAPERMSSGVAALDVMLSDGYWKGASTLVAGPSGVGKTLLALHFIFAGAQRGETGLIATFQENPTQLERVLQGFSWSLRDPGIELMYRSPVDLYLDEWVYDFLDTVQRTNASRVAIDSLGDLSAASGDQIRFREYIYSLLQRCARSNISVTMTLEVPDLFGITRLSEYGVSHLSDNVILLQFLRGESELKRAITVLKTRGSSHEQQLQQFDISPKGISLTGQFQEDQSLS